MTNFTSVTALITSVTDGITALNIAIFMSAMVVIGGIAFLARRLVKGMR
jgi:hypothetical protein